VFEVSREELWSALTDPARLAEWFANDVSFDARQGGAGVFRWDDGEERRARVLDVVEEERLAFTWADEAGVRSTVELELEEVEAGTRLTVTETTASGAEQTVPEWSLAVGLGALAQHLSPVLV
jgi:uncharacterized protein YndB with AHSA1/START domain